MTGENGRYSGKRWGGRTGYTERKRNRWREGGREGGSGARKEGVEERWVGKIEGQ